MKKYLIKYKLEALKNIYQISILSIKQRINISRFCIFLAFKYADKINRQSFKNKSS